MGFGVLRIDIVDIVGGYQINAQLFGQPELRGIDRLLIRYAVILDFQEKVVPAEYLLIAQGGLFALFIVAPGKLALTLAGQAGA